MAVIIHPHADGHGERDLSPSAALRYAWYWYLSLLFVPFLMFLAVITTLNYKEGTPSHMVLRNWWFVSAIVFQIVAGPIAFWLRSRLFRAYWRGEAVSPRHYLQGMLIVWITFELGGLLSLIGCLASNSLLPCLLPALAAFMFFTPVWPNGKAMVRPTGNTDDPEIYSEPR